MQILTRLACANFFFHHLLFLYNGIFSIYAIAQDIYLWNRLTMDNTALYVSWVIYPDL